MSPPQLVKAVLQAPVDLIFFGGIGTFVKAWDESDTDVDDAANDDVRVSAEQLRARVVAEGANLAVTQRARVAYSRRGGRVNTDFVDNAAGVAMSDREVNLKILLSLAEATGRLAPGDGDRLLLEARDDAAAAVLSQVDGGVVALDRAALAGGSDLQVYEALIEELEAAGMLERSTECLPGPEELARRRQAGAGLSRPELAVVMAYERSALACSVQASRLPERPGMADLARAYFPAPLREPFSDLVTSHPLFAQLVSSQVANQVTKQMGPIWAYEVSAELGCPLSQVAGADQSAAEVLGAAWMEGEVDALSSSLQMDAELALRSAISAGVDRLARWYLRHPGASGTAGRSALDERIMAELARHMGAEKRDRADWTSLGVPAELAGRAAQLADLAGVGEVGHVALASGARSPLPSRRGARSIALCCCVR